MTILTTQEVKKKEKKEYDFDILGSFCVNVKENKPKKILKNILIKKAAQLRNLLIILEKELYIKSSKSIENKYIYKLFTSNSTLRDAIYGRTGEKGLPETAEKLSTLKNHLKDHKMWKEICFLSQSRLDSKTTYSIIKELSKNRKEALKRREMFFDDKKNYIKKFKTNGVPNLPKTKKLKSISSFSIMLDPGKWNFQKETIKKNNIKKTHHFLVVKIGTKQTKIPTNPSNYPINDEHSLRSLNVRFVNDEIELHFTYGKIEKKEIVSNKKLLKKNGKKKLIRNKIKKIASIDMGLKLLFTVFVNDFDTKSFSFSNKKMIKKNSEFNRLLAKIDKSISKEATEFKEITRNVKDCNGDDVLNDKNEKVIETTKIATKWTKRGVELKLFKRFLFKKKNNFFNSEYEKISTHLANKLVSLGVTDLVISKNLSYLKIKQNKTMLHKKTQQKFYQIPMMRFLSKLIEKLDGKINIHEVDEAHTSKTSCLSKDVNDMKKLRKTKGKSLSVDEYGGIRAKRGSYKDKKTGIKFHSDVNGAANHMKLKFKKIDLTWLKNHKEKICNPIIYKKSDEIAFYADDSNKGRSTMTETKKYKEIKSNQFDQVC